MAKLDRRSALVAMLLMAAGILMLFPAVAQSGHGGDELEAISPDRVKLLLDSGEKILFIDLRSAKEFQQKRLPGARSIPFTELEKRFGEIPRAGRVVLYCGCRPGDDSYAFFLLRDQGYFNVTVLEDGFPAWLQRKYPVESGLPSSRPAAKAR